jgi:hypothetical protein
MRHFGRGIPPGRPFIGKKEAVFSLNFMAGPKPGHF